MTFSSGISSSYSPKSVVPWGWSGKEGKRGGKGSREGERERGKCEDSEEGGMGKRGNGECKDGQIHTLQNGHILILRPILGVLLLKLLTVGQGEGSLKSIVSLLLGLERIREDGVTNTLQGRGERGCFQY